MQVVNKVRGKLSKLERKTLSALIVIDVHARDVAVELGNSNISSESDFEWMSQLRVVTRICLVMLATVGCFPPASNSITQCGWHVLETPVDMLHMRLQCHFMMNDN